MRTGPGFLHEGFSRENATLACNSISPSTGKPSTCNRYKQGCGTSCLDRPHRVLVPTLRRKQTPTTSHLQGSGGGTRDAIACLLVILSKSGPNLSCMGINSLRLPRAKVLHGGRRASPPCSTRVVGRNDTRPAMPTGSFYLFFQSALA